MPCMIYERNITLSDEMLPAVEDYSTGLWYYGITEVVKFYSRACGLHEHDLLSRALAFIERHPNYHIHESLEEH